MDRRLCGNRARPLGLLREAITEMIRRNRISGQFSVRLIEMLESAAYRQLSLSAHRVISRIEIELAHHGGNDNGKLPVTYEDFIHYGVHRHSIAPAIREAVALGFIEVTKRGRGGNAEDREPSLYRLTFAHDRDSRQRPPTHEWRKIKTPDDADAAARLARAAASAQAVSNGARRNRNQCRKPAPVPPPESGTENRNFPPPESGTTGSVQKPALLSISRVGERSGLTEAPLQPDLTSGAARDPIPLSWATPFVTEVTDRMEAAAIRAALTTTSPQLRQAMVRRGWAGK
jgi:hypothetical protein